MNKTKLIHIGCWLLPWMPLSYLAAGIVFYQTLPGHHPVPTAHFDGQGKFVSIDPHESEVYLHLVALLPLIIFAATVVFIVGLVLLVVGLFLRTRTAQTPHLAIETAQESDGRWMAEIAQIPGALCYGANRQEAISKVEALALRVLADRLEHGATPPELEAVFSVAA